MTEIKFPSIIGITLQGDMLVRDSKDKIRTLKNFNHQTGRKTYKDKGYDGPIKRQASFSIEADKVKSFGEWKAEQSRNKTKEREK